MKKLSPLNLKYVRICKIPGICEGKGDDVVALKGNNVDTGTFTNKGSSNFIVFSYGKTDSNLLINVIGNYNGQVLIPSDDFLLVVKSDGDWRADIATK
jgi:hypothetical protein